MRAANGGTHDAAPADMADVLARALCVVALTGCTVHTRAERPRVAIKNAAWLVGGVAVGAAGVWMIRDAGAGDDRGLGGAAGAVLLGTGAVMALGATLGLLGVAFDEVPAR